MGIGFLLPEELPKFRAFLNEHWRPRHALVESPSLLDWMYRDANRDEYHFVVSRHEDGSLTGVLGFLPLEHFDPALDGRDLWLQLWKVRDDARGQGLGSQLYKFLVQRRQPRSVCGFGLSEGVKATYTRLGFTLGTLNHYFLGDARRSRFEMLAGWQPAEVVPPACRVRFVPLDSPERFLAWANRLDRAAGQPHLPAKSPEFFRRRYFDHPIYRYEVFALAEGERPRGFAVLRVAGNGRAFALKWVDYYGDFNALIGTQGRWLDLLSHYDAEYVELHNLGLPSGTLAAAGFERRLPDSPIVVPCYFEPFEARNVEIAYAQWSASDLPYHIFKGDSDQDRPTWVPPPRRSSIITDAQPWLAT